MKYNAYLIPGFGEDERVFKNFVLNDCNTICLNWNFSNEMKSYEEYAKKVLLPQIKIDKPIVLIGLSMGGMVAVELAKLIKPSKLVFIASAKNRLELSKGKVSFMRIIKPYKYLSKNTLVKLSKVLIPVFKLFNKEYQNLFNAIDNTIPEGAINFGMRALLTWNNRELPKQDYIHIHGIDDKLIPIKRIKNHIKVPGGHYLLKTKSRRLIIKMVNDYISK